MSASTAARFEACIGSGGVTVFPSDTVYGLACDPLNAEAVRRLYALKGRAPAKAAAVMFFALDAALAALPEIGERTRGALVRLLPGGVTALLPNPSGRFPLAGGEDPFTLGLRVPFVPALAGVGRPVLQSSANPTGGADPRRLDDVPESLLRGADLVIDGGELPGTASTVVDLRRYEPDLGGAWSVVRPGAVDAATLAAALDWRFQFDPGSYAAMIREDIPVYDILQDELVAASGEGGARRILELGTGTGKTAGRLLARHAGASLVGIDESPTMLESARRALPEARASLLVRRLQDSLPEGPFDLVASALCVHHLDEGEKADLFARVAAVVAQGGRFVLADVVVPVDPADARTSLTPGFDKPSTVPQQLAWMAEAGFAARVAWAAGDLAVIAADIAGG